MKLIFRQKIIGKERGWFARYRLPLLTCVFGIAIGAAATAQAQPTGSAAKGSSLTRERVSDPRAATRIPDLVKYRASIKELKLNEELLVSHLKDANDGRSSVKLKHIILAYLVGRPLFLFDDLPGRIDFVVVRLLSGGEFDASLQVAFNLSPDDFRRRKKVAENLLKIAMKTRFEK